MEMIREAVHEVQRPVFFARAIIITAYLPMFTLQHVEGRLFRPMALTVTFALVGALLFSLSILPVLALLLFGPSTKEWRNPLLDAIIGGYRRSSDGR
jgi:cobalt-zinc-cadmium resistance protein CzcA